MLWNHLKLISLLLIFLSTTLQGCGSGSESDQPASEGNGDSTPDYLNWLIQINPDAQVIATSVTDAATFTDTNLKPLTTTDLVGIKFNYTLSDPGLAFLLNSPTLDSNYENLVHNLYFKHGGSVLLDMDETHPPVSNTSLAVVHEFGNTDACSTAQAITETVVYLDTKTQIQYTAVVNGVMHTCHNGFIRENKTVSIVDQSDQLLAIEDGTLTFQRLGPGALTENSQIENSLVKDPLTLSAGHYKITVTDNKGYCSFIIEDFVLTPDILANSPEIKIAAENACTNTYTVRVFYENSGLLLADVEWNNITINFAEVESEVSEVDIADIPSGNTPIPFRVTDKGSSIPGIEETIFVSTPADDVLPEVNALSSGVLGGCYLDADSNNNLSLFQDVAGLPVSAFLELEFNIICLDVNGNLVPSTVWISRDVGTTVTDASLGTYFAYDSFPVTFVEDIVQGNDPAPIDLPSAFGSVTVEFIKE